MAPSTHQSALHPRRAGRRRAPGSAPELDWPAQLHAGARPRRSYETRERMAKTRNRKAPTRRRDKRGGPGSGRRKPCPYCRDKIDRVDYRDIATLRKFISDKGKIRSRRITGACRRHQSQIARAVKRARELALLHYVAEDRQEGIGRGGRFGRDRDRDRDKPAPWPRRSSSRTWTTSAAAGPSSTSRRATCATISSRASSPSRRRRARSRR